MKKIKVGIISPAANVLKVFPKRREEGKKNLEEIGMEPIFSKNAIRFNSSYKESVEERLEELNEIIDENPDLVITTIGGYNSIQLLDKIDYKKIKEKNITFCGFSDITSLLLAIYTKTGMEMLYGPCYTVNMCDYGGVDEYTKDNLLKCFSGKKFTLKPAEYDLNEFIDWADLENKVIKKKKKEKGNDWITINKGKCSGILLGGNLTTIQNLIGTKYLPEKTFKDKLLFLEDCETNMDEFCSRLESLRIKGILDNVTGIIFGKFDTEEMNKEIEAFLKDYFKDYDKPVVCNIDFGHVYPILTIPIGREANLECTDKKIKIELLERK